MRITARLYMPSVEQMIKDYGLNKGGKVQKFIDQFILEQSEPYVPHDSGNLVASASRSTEVGSGQIIWDTPYAHYLHEGRLMVSPTTKSSWARKGEQKVYAEPPKTLMFHSGDSNRKEHWIDRFLIDKKEELIKECEKLINGG